MLEITVWLNFYSDMVLIKVEKEDHMGQALPWTAPSCPAVCDGVTMKWVGRKGTSYANPIHSMNLIAINN